MNKVLINSLVCWVALSGVAAGQSTQGLIGGQVGPSGHKFYVMYCRVDAGGKIVDTGDAETDKRGYYALPFLTPGDYRLRAQGEKPGSEKPIGSDKSDCFRSSPAGVKFQAHEKHELTLPVAGSLVVDFDLRPADDLFDRERVQTKEGRLVTYFGLDVKKIEWLQIDTGLAGVETGGSSVSYVVDPRSIETLPFTGQDVFAALVLQPGVTADNATGRGLGLSVNGQRVASSNFLLDGVAYNDDLLTGPASQLSPESVQEYRISTNNFTAESGGASGFVANAVTRSGGNRFHGALFGRLGDQRLSGRSFERRYMGAERGTDRERRIGLRLGGPVWGKQVFYSGSYEAFGTRTDGAPQTYQVLSEKKIVNCVSFLNPQSKWLLAIRPKGLAAGKAVDRPSYCNELRSGVDPPHPDLKSFQDLESLQNAMQRDLTEPLTTVSSARTENYLFTGRVDTKLPRDGQLMIRAVSWAARRPEFVPSLYEGFSPTLTQPSNDVALQLTMPLLPNRLVHEVRVAGLSREFAWNRPEPAGIAEKLQGLVSPSRGVPFFQVDNAPLAGSPVAYEFDYRQNSGFVSDQAILHTGQHIVSFGGEGAFRNSRLYLPYLKSGVVHFSDVWRFVSPPEGFSAASVDRKSQWERGISHGSTTPSLRGLPPPEYRTKLSAKVFSGYVQDYWRISSRLTLQLGLRFENYGFPKDQGQQKGFLISGGGGSVADWVKEAKPSWDGRLASEIRGSSHWQIRSGVAYSVVKSGNVVVRAAYGTYSDRLFENLVQTLRNNIGVVGMTARPSRPCPPRPPSDPPSMPIAIPSVDDQLGCGLVRNIRDLPFLWLDPDLRTPLIQNWLGGLDWRASPGFLLSIHSMGSQGSRLITSDLLNRDTTKVSNSDTRTLGPIAYRSNSGDSNFKALAFRVSYRARRLLVQAAYTYSRAIDVQSDALRGDFFDLTRTTWGDLVKERSFSQLLPNPIRAQFTVPLTPSVDRGNSDFDQRHNFVVYSAYDAPAVSTTRRWLRVLTSEWRISEVAGVRSGFPFTPIDTNGIRLRADGSAPLFSTGANWGSSVALLNAGAFQVTDLGMNLPNLARNVLTGPGFWNLDVAISKTLPSGERYRLEIRADAFNLVNHANLGRPNAVGPANAFGQATYGRAGFSSNFPGIVPLAESARRVQLVVRFSF